jgi:hypothetical protein
MFSNASDEGWQFANRPALRYMTELQANACSDILCNIRSLLGGQISRFDFAQPETPAFTFLRA